MNKRLIITVLIGIIFVAGAFFGAMEYLSYKDVTVKFKVPNISIKIHNSDGNEIASVSANSTTRLKEGTYYYVPVSDTYSTDPVDFEVTGDETLLEVSPAYSTEYLASLLTKEQKPAQEALLAAYPEIKTNYIIGDEKLAYDGKWYTAKLMQRVSGGNEPDVYRVILKKTGDTWSTVVAPQLALSIKENPEVPEAAIRQVNEPLSTAAYALLYPE